MNSYTTLNDLISALGNRRDNSLTLEKLLERAYDIRKFEIELYWKRASYFWGFLIAAFTAYFIVSDVDKFDPFSITKLSVICIGYIFSLSWYYVNRGSLYWQYNYERLIEAIEESLEISFYKSNLINTNSRIDIFSAHPFALGRINIMVSLFICIMWLFFLGLYFFYPINTFSLDKEVDFGKLILVLVTLAFSLILFFKGKFNFSTQRTFSFGSRKIHYTR